MLYFHSSSFPHCCYISHAIIPEDTSLGWSKCRNWRKPLLKIRAPPPFLLVGTYQEPRVIIILFPPFPVSSKTNFSWILGVLICHFFKLDKMWLWGEVYFRIFMQLNFGKCSLKILKWHVLLFGNALRVEGVFYLSLFLKTYLGAQQMWGITHLIGLLNWTD